MFSRYIYQIIKQFVFNMSIHKSTMITHWVYKSITITYNCYALTKIIGNFGEKYRKPSPTFSKCEYFCQNWRIIMANNSPILTKTFSFWENWRTLSVFFLRFSHDFCQCGAFINSYWVLSFRCLVDWYFAVTHLFCSSCMDDQQ